MLRHSLTYTLHWDRGTIIQSRAHAPDLLRRLFPDLAQYLLLDIWFWKVDSKYDWSEDPMLATMVEYNRRTLERVRPNLVVNFGKLSEDALYAKWEAYWTAEKERV